MKTDKKILIAFLLNLCFSIFEMIGGWLSGSVAISADALHDLGDALSIGLSYILERKSQKTGDARYSHMGGAITSFVLIIGSLFMIDKSINRMVHPAEIHYDGMLMFALVGLLVNGLAVYFTHGGHSVNQKAVNLHMLEDVLGWVVVLVGAVVMRLTNFWFIDPIMSIGVAAFILIHAVKHSRAVIRLLLKKEPIEALEDTHCHHHH